VSRPADAAICPRCNKHPLSANGWCVACQKTTVTAALRRKKGAPSKREQDLANDLSVAAHDLREAEDYAQTYIARVAVNQAIAAYDKFLLAGRPHA
jgi:hypothetical protein